MLGYYFLGLLMVYQYVGKISYILKLHIKHLEVTCFIMFVIYFRELQHKEIDETGMAKC